MHFGAVGVVVEGATVSRLSSQLSSKANSARARQSPQRAWVCIRLYYNWHVAEEMFDVDLLDEEDPFDVDAQAAHLFKHPRLGIEDIREVWASDPMFYPAKPPAHWLMVAEVDGTVLMVPLPLPATATPNDAAPSAATKPPNTSLINTGETDEPPHDPRRGIRVLRAPGKPGTPGPGRRRLTATVPVRFPPELLEQVRAAAAADDRSVSSWIRRAVEHELRHPA